MDNMLEHPGTELQVIIKEKGLTQKAFASILGKKVSEVNELLKGKRNITIQRDYLLHQHLGTPIKYWILKQVDYDYSLLYIEEIPHNEVILSDSEESTVHQTRHSERSEESTAHQTRHSERSEESTAHQTRHSERSEESTSQQIDHSEPEWRKNPSNTTSIDFSLQSKGQDNVQDFYPINETPSGLSEGQTNTQETPVEESKDDEDLQNRAKIFRTF